jgi:hypothetical protein
LGGLPLDGASEDISLDDMDKTDLLDYLHCLEEVENVHPTGSSYICDPPVTDTDEDYILFTPTTSLLVAGADLEASGFTCGWLEKRRKAIAQAGPQEDTRERWYVDDPRQDYMDRPVDFTWINVDRVLPVENRPSWPIYYYTLGPAPLQVPSPPPEPQFISLRRGRINVILTNDKPFYNGFVTATELAKKLNVTKKEHRIELFDTILNRVSVSRQDKDGKKRWVYDVEEAPLTF